MTPVPKISTESNRLTHKGLGKKLHATINTEYQLEDGLHLDYVARKGAPVLVII